jgi:uncharacterized membrane protein YphA (DoxX/SURF4 family)
MFKKSQSSSILATLQGNSAILVRLDKGFWAMAHEYRTDFAMTVLLIYLFIYGAGNWSLDRIILKHQEHRL